MMSTHVEPLPHPRRTRSDRRPRRLLSFIPFGIAALALLPVLVVASSLLTPDLEVWRHLRDTMLLELTLNTLTLLAGVGLGTLVLGTGLAWLVTAYDFPGKKAFQWLLILPMAMPAYIMGFIYMALFDFAGPVQETLRSMGWKGGLPEIRSGPGAVVVMTLVLFPYVYLLARAGFRELSPSAIDAARVLGSTRSGLFFRVVLPLARPSIAAGVSLAAMEALADFATVRYFNFPTISDGILRVWHGLMNLDAASEMAGLLSIFALLLLLLEQRMRSRRAYHQNKGKGQRYPSISLHGWRGGAASAFCLAVLTASFGLPTAQLLVWAVRALTVIDAATLSRYTHLALNSLFLAGLAAGFVALTALVLAGSLRAEKGRLAGIMARAATTGYSLPGAVIAVGILLPLSFLDRFVNDLSVRWWGFGPGLILTGSLAGLLYAYTVRFMAVAYSSIDSSMEKIPPNTISAARVLGAGSWRRMFSVQLPLIAPGILAGATLTFVDVMKELPITVVLRPLGYDTLAIWVWQMAAESLWMETALPALAIVAAGLIPIRLLTEAGD
ncbi:MAG TPA: iron ABC transporter permease [Magnetospirillaceae bacterium]|nr:iron ABC transporter permease [Magnetospirillaceae bacterium]